jgi:thioester reductase-like protein
MTKTDKTVLVTGFPSSFLGTRVLSNVLEHEPEARVVAVVHEKFLPNAAAIAKSLPQAAAARLSILEGDAAAMDLGLSGKEFGRLANEVDVIHHCAAVTYLGAERARAEAVNVGATKEVLELAYEAKQLERLVHWSTALVSGAKRGFVGENDLDSGRGFRNVIEETRFRAEELAEAAKKDLPVTILRPAMVVGDATTGEIDRFEGLYLLIQLMLNAPPEVRIPMPGKSDIPLNLVPVSYAVDAGCHIARSPRSTGKTFHIVDPRPLSAQRVFELIANEAGRPLPRMRVPPKLAAALLRTPLLDKIAQGPRAFLEQLGTEVIYDARNADELLAGSGLECPPFESYVGVMVQAVREKLLEQKRRTMAETSDSLDDPLG